MKKTFLFTIIAAVLLLFSTVGCEKEGPAPAAGGGGKANLTIETVNGPNTQDCGGFDWKVKFNLNNASAADGWIVQKITYERNVIKCPDMPFLNDKITYWEAWRVTAGASGDSERLAGKFNYDDQYSSPNFPDTRGSTTITGEVKFFEGLALPASFTKGNKDTYAGGLPATNAKPDFWDAANTAGHNLSYIWNCCTAAGIHVLTTTPDSKKTVAVIPADTSKLDYIGKLIYRIPDWTTGYYTYPETNMQLVNISRQVQNSSSTTSLLNALVKYEKTFAGTTDYLQHMSKAYLLLRVLYQLPQQMNGNAQTFGGWIHPSIGKGSAYNMSWPVSATAGPSGIQVNVDAFTGFLGRTYNAAAEMNYFNANFQRRNL
jgi:hypothetical protein